MASFDNNLRLEEITTGAASGTWGTKTNTNLSLIGKALGYATEASFSSDADVTTTVADGSTDPARALYFKVTSGTSLSTTRTLTIGPNTVSRVMFIENATSGSQSINISQGSGANVTIANGKTAVVYLDGAGSGAAVVLASPQVTVTQLTDVTSTASELNLVDGSSAGTIVNSKAVIYGSSGEVNGTTLQIAGNAITSTAAELNLIDGSSAGTIVNSKAVIYGSSGEVNATTLQLAGSAITSTAAELNILDGVTATATELNLLDGVTATTTELNILDGVTATTAELNYSDGVTSNIQTQLNAKPGTSSANTFTALQTFSGSSSALATKIESILEPITITAGTLSSTQTFDALTQSVQYYTNNQGNNWTINFRGDGSNTLNSLMSVGDALTLVVLATMSGSAYYNSAIQVDGSSPTVEWQGGSAPSAGNANSVDSYTYTIVKTADATFTVFAAQTQFA